MRGVCSMARAQNPNSANSQFFICFDDARFLDKQYTVWGKVIEGMENVDKIKRGEPVQNPDKIKSLKVAADVKYEVGRPSAVGTCAVAQAAGCSCYWCQTAEVCLLPAMRTDLFDFDLPDERHRAGARLPARCRAAARGAALPLSPLRGEVGVGAARAEQARPSP